MADQLQIIPITKKPDVGEFNPYLNCAWRERECAYHLEGPDKTLYIVVSSKRVSEGKKWYNAFYRRHDDNGCDWVGSGGYFTTIDEIAEEWYPHHHTAVVKQLEMAL